MLPRKKVLDSPIPWAHKFFGQDFGQVSRLRFGKFTSVVKNLSIFLKYDSKTVETCLDPRMAVVSFPKALESNTGE